MERSGSNPLFIDDETKAQGHSGSHAVGHSVEPEPELRPFGSQADSLNFFSACLVLLPTKSFRTFFGKIYFMSACAWEGQNDLSFPGAGVSGGCELPDL